MRDTGERFDSILKDLDFVQRTLNRAKEKSACLDEKIRFQRAVTVMRETRAKLRPLYYIVGDAAEVVG